MLGEDKLIWVWITSHPQLIIALRILSSLIWVIVVEVEKSLGLYLGFVLEIALIYMVEVCVWMVIVYHFSLFGLSVMGLL